MEVAIVAGLFAKGKMDVNASHAGYWCLAFGNVKSFGLVIFG